jgi:hypothetical protein
MGIGRIDLAQCFHECGQVDSRLIQIVDGAVGVLARQPLVDGPLERIVLSRVSPRQLHGNREWQVRREFRQPLRLLRCLLRGPSDARQPSG